MNGHLALAVWVARVFTCILPSVVNIYGWRPPTTFAPFAKTARLELSFCPHGVSTVGLLVRSDRADSPSWPSSAHVARDKGKVVAVNDLNLQDAIWLARGEALGRWIRAHFAVLFEAAPVVVEAAPVVVEAAPVVVEAALVVVEAAPVVVEAAPVVLVATPVAPVAGPLVVEAAP